MFEKTGLERVPALKMTLSILVTFSILAFSLFFFRANSLHDSLTLISNAFEFGNSAASIFELLKDNELIFGILMVIFLLIAEYLHEKYNLVRVLSTRPIVLRWPVYIGFIFFILLFGVLHKQVFLYFQF